MSTQPTAALPLGMQGSEAHQIGSAHSLAGENRRPSARAGGQGLRPRETQNVMTSSHRCP